MTTQTPTPKAVTAEPVPPAALAPAGAGTTSRQEFNGLQISSSAELATARAEAEARALVESRYVMALKRPRDWDNVRVNLMKEVERPGFAEVAWYRKPIGNGVEGLSVRFAEAAARCMGNLMIDPQVSYEDDEKRVVRVMATDLECNLTLSLDVTVEKTVERTSLTDGRVAISVRKNSNNKLTYTVPATEDEMLGKTNSLVSKARRNLVLQILPGDILDEAKRRILEIRRGAIAKDPEGARKKVVDSFAGLNVMPADLKRWLGHDVGQCTPAETQQLRDLYSSIQSGETTWHAALAEKLGEQEEATGSGAPPKPGLDGLTEKLKAEQSAAGGAGAPPPIVKVPPGECGHQPILERVAATRPGTVITCPACDTDVEGTLTEEEAKAAVQAIAGAAAPETTGTKKPRQGRLQE